MTTELTADNTDGHGSEKKRMTRWHFAFIGAHPRNPWSKTLRLKAFALDLVGLEDSTALDGFLKHQSGSSLVSHHSCAILQTH